MGGRSLCREEKICAVLDEYTVKRIGVIASPELVMIFQCTEVETAATRRTQLNKNIRVFCTNPFVNTVQALCIVNPEMSLIFFGQIFGTEIIHVTVCIPFYIRDIRRQSDHFIKRLYNKVLYLRITQIE